MEERIDDPRNATVLGLDIGGTKSAVVEGTREADILQRREMPTEAHLPLRMSFPISRV